MPQQQPMPLFDGRLPTVYARPEDDIDLRELFRALWAGRWWILFCVVLSGAVATGIALWLPNIYHVEAKLVPTGRFGVALDLAKSRQFVTQFINKHQLAVPIMAATAMDEKTQQLRIDPDLFDQKSGKWVRKVKATKKPEPSHWELYKAFNEIFSLERDKTSGLVTVAFDYYSPAMAKQWVDSFIVELDSAMKEPDLADAERNIAYLMQQLSKVPKDDKEMREVLSKSIREQDNIRMYVKANPEYAFKVLDPADIPEEKAKPKRALMVVLGTLLGGMLGVMIVLLRHALSRKKSSDDFHNPDGC